MIATPPITATLSSFFRNVIQLSRPRDRKNKDIAGSSSEAIIAWEDEIVTSLIGKPTRPQERDIDQQIQLSNPWTEPSQLIKKIQIAQHQRSKEETSLLSTLPSSLHLEIMTFLYDDLESLGSLFESLPGLAPHVSYKDLKVHVADSIRSSRNYDISCRICAEPMSYPYQLVESCGHQVCGRCAWTRRQELSSCGCGVKIRSRPKRLDPTLVDCKAYWLFSEEENQRRFARNDVPVHRDHDGMFGQNGVANTNDAFERLSFEADYDHLQTIDISKHSEIVASLPSRGRNMVVTLCPAHVNYSPYFVEDFTLQELQAIWPVLLGRSLFRSISKDDIVILEEEAVDADYDSLASTRATMKTASKKRFEARLVGWEHLVRESANYNF